MTEVPCVEHHSSPPENPTGRLVIRYLQKNEDGATATQIVQHLREEMKTDTRDLDKIVGSILENGTALGFLERKGSHYMTWMHSRICERKRRRSCTRRRRHRRIRRKRSRCCRQRCRRKC